MKRPKTFVLDTNVILHDSECIYNFEDNDVVIPITVLEELDKFKRGDDQISLFMSGTIHSISLDENIIQVT